VASTDFEKVIFSGVNVKQLSGFSDLGGLLALQQLCPHPSGGGGTARSDNFNRASSGSGLGTPSDGGSAWVADASNFGIFSNQAYGAGGGAPTIESLECNSGDGTVQVTVTSAGGNACLSFRVSDGNNCWVLAAVVGTFYEIYQRSGGSIINVKTGGSAPVNGDVVSVVLSGTSITVKVNGIAIAALASTDSGASLTRTRHGVAANSDASTLLDNWSYTP
jgi:hypothetical protein